MVHLLFGVIYLSFVSLGLPDSLLGSAWPSMYGELGVPFSWAGAVSTVISAGTVVSSLQSGRLTRRWGAGRVTAVSVGMTAAALLGFSVSGSFWAVCLWAVPYGLGAGSVDAALNNYVAVHFASRHMSWLHCMWGVGASTGPWLIGAALAGGGGWRGGYRWVALIQIAITALVVLSLPLWRSAGGEDGERAAQPLRLGELLRIPGVRAVTASFFCYCALEQTAILWAGTYLTLYRGIPAERAAGFAGLFCAGITVGRGLSGFLTLKFSDVQLVRLGQGGIALGLLLLPLGEGAALAGLLLTGLGCAPIYPSIIHATPARFGAERSQSIIGVQMASAYLGTCLMPPLFGAAAGRLGTGPLPLYLLGLLVLMTLAHERLVRVAPGAGSAP